MSNYFIISRYGIIAFFVAMMVAFVFATLTHAEENESSPEATQKYHIMFPIAELGNCNSLSECRTYCEDSANHQACLDFAKKKGFYKDKSQTLKTDLMTAAKTELGCDSDSSCRTFCGEQQNWEKCGEFAKRHRLGGGQTAEASKSVMLERAKELLGCSSYDSCKAFCSQAGNHQKCEDFGRRVRMLLGGPGSKATSGGTLDRSFCRNIKEKFPNATEEQIKRYYTMYCLQNSGSGSPSSTVMSKEEYCRKFPDRCNFSPKPYPYSTTSGTTTYDPARYCSEKGCSFNGTNCQCPSPSPVTGVQGVSTGGRILQTILGWLGL